MDKIDRHLRGLVLGLNKLKKIEYKNICNEIKYIIDNNIKDEKYIESIFDRLLSLVYIMGEEVSDMYNILYEYYKNINKEASEDYKKYCLEILNEVEW